MAAPLSDSEIDAIYDFVEVLLKRGRFDFLDLIINDVAVDIITTEDVSLDEAITWLTVTLCVKNKLLSREFLYRVTVKKWAAAEAENYKALFIGLE